MSQISGLIKTSQGGQFKTLTATIAGNTAVILSPAAGKRWLVLAGELRITAGAAVANRNMHMQIRYPANNYKRQFATGRVFVATNQYWFGFGEVNYVVGPPVPGPDGGTVNDYMGTTPIIVNDTDFLQFYINNGDVGDSILYFVEVLEVVV